MDRIKVLYIAGSNRCGSTLLARLLGDLPGFTAVGEAATHFCQGSRDDHVPCGCGLSVQTCPFWKEISLPLDADPFAARWLRLRRAPFLESYIRRHPEHPRRLISSLGNFYDMIAQRAGAQVIVDSSKSPLHARLLSWIPNVDLYVLHLVRDPRSVVASSRRPKQWLPGASPLHATARWLGLTLGSEYLRTWLPNMRTVRYEDFVKAPGPTTLQISAALGYKLVDLSFIHESTADLGPQHMLGSNPDKLQGGPTRIVEKSTDLPWIKRFFVSVLTAPALWRYGYWSEPRRRKLPDAVSQGTASIPEMVVRETTQDF